MNETPAPRKRYCWDCGSENLRHDGFTKAGTPRWSCGDCPSRRAKFRTTPKPSQLDTLERYQELKKRIATAIAKRQDLTIVVTSAQNATPTKQRFLTNLIACRDHHKGELVVIPYRYRNPTSIWSQQAQDDDWWDPSIEPFLLNQQLLINPNLVLMGDVRIQPTAVRPLAGLESMSGDKSAIFGHPQVAATSIPTPQNKMPKVLMTTGACTVKNYIPSKAGKQGEFHHTFAGTIIELRNGYFYTRQLIANNDGDFIDLDKQYKDGKVSDAPRAAALVMGDTHWEFLAPNVLEATFKNKDSMLALLRPRNLVWHDAWDGYAQSHHHKSNPFIKYAKIQSGRNKMQASLDGFFEFVDDVTPIDTKNVFVASNHPEFLMRWLKETNPWDDLTNAPFWLEAAAHVLKGTTAIPEGTYIPDAFSWYGKKKLKCWGRTKFLERGESFILHGVEMGYHGDKGAGGKPGTLLAYAKIGVRNIVGHHHNVGITGGAYCVGMSAYNMDYTKGQLNAAIHAHCVLYANGKRSLLFIMPDGSWHG